jgi:hypothetical protein
MNKQMALQVSQDKIADFCQRNHICKLALSALFCETTLALKATWMCWWKMDSERNPRSLAAGLASECRSNRIPCIEDTSRLCCEELPFEPGTGDQSGLFQAL